MKKCFLWLSLICLVISIVVYWFCGFWTGLGMTILLGAIIALVVYLLKNDAKWWIVIVLVFVSLNILGGSFTALTINRGFEATDNNISEETEVIEEDENVEETNEETLDEEKQEEKDIPKDETLDEDPQPAIVTKTERVEVPVERVVEKVVEKKVEVPVEKVVEKEVIKEVPVVEYVEVEKEPEVKPQSTQTPVNVPSYNYYGDPTSNSNYGYGNYGDPTGRYGNYNSSAKISGKTNVTAGNSYTYTISGVNSISKNQISLPSNVSIKNISGNRVTLYFQDGWTGSYSIGYGSAAINVKVSAS